MPKDRRLPDDMDDSVAEEMRGGMSKAPAKPKPAPAKISADDDESDQAFFTRKKLSLAERRAKAKEGLIDSAMKK